MGEKEEILSLNFFEFANDYFIFLSIMNIIMYSTIT